MRTGKTKYPHGLKENLGNQSSRLGEAEDAAQSAKQAERLLQRADKPGRRERTRWIESMVWWFDNHFEDPALNTPWDAEANAYNYIFGGPFDARDVLREFWRVPETWRSVAAGQIERDGIFEWSPRSTGEFYGRLSDFEDPQALDELSTSEDESRAAILARLDQLESWLAELPVSPSNFGHNIPPDDIGLPPYADETKKELNGEIGVVRNQLTRQNPDKEILEKSQIRFQDLAKKLVVWLGRKSDVAIDESIKTGVKAIIWSKVIESLFGLSEQITHFIKTFF